MADNSILNHLLDIGAIHLSAATPFQWASGWLSPIYCDNRKALSSHEAREKILDGIVRIINGKYPRAAAVVGVATGAIAMGALVAHALRLPFAYVRPKPKDHGLGNQIEGHLPAGSSVVVVEDLISTGGSSLAAVAALRKANIHVLGMVAIFTYAFPQAEVNFANAQVTLDTLESYPALLSLLSKQGQLTEEDLLSLDRWRQAPESWGR